MADKGEIHGESECVRSYTFLKTKYKQRIKLIVTSIETVFSVAIVDVTCSSLRPLFCN